MCRASSIVVLTCSRLIVVGVGGPTVAVAATDVCTRNDFADDISSGDESRREKGQNRRGTHVSKERVTVNE